MENASYFESKIASGLVELRKSRKITQEELAKMLGTKQTVISRIENGVSVPSWEFVNRMAKALDAEVDITFNPISSQEKYSSTRALNSNLEYICVNCMYRWESKLERPVIQCPQCHKRQGILYSEYSKALEALKDIRLQVKRNPPFKKLPPVRSLRDNSPKILKLILETAGSTFSSPKLPVSLLFRIIKKSSREQVEKQPGNIIRSASDVNKSYTRNGVPIAIHHTGISQNGK